MTLSTTECLSLKRKEREPMPHLACKEAPHIHLQYALPDPTKTHRGGPCNSLNMQDHTSQSSYRRNPYPPIDTLIPQSAYDQNPHPSMYILRRSPYLYGGTVVFCVLVTWPSLLPWKFDTSRKRLGRPRLAKFFVLRRNVMRLEGGAYVCSHAPWFIVGRACSA